MIGMRLVGGLGNQMFQYAAGLATARRLGCQLIVIPGSTNFRRASWQAPGELAASFEGVALSPADFLLGIATITLGLDFVERTVRSYLPNHYSPPRHPGFEGDTVEAYDSGFEYVPDGTWLSGYFQSQRYFADIEDVVRHSYKPSPRLSERVKIVTSSLPAPPHKMAAVHIRRRDYLTQGGGYAHPVLGWALPNSYYAAALERLPPGTPLAVFSDDLKYARSIVRGDAVWFAPSDLSGAEALACFSQFAIKVVANSSLSWWGAWLGASGGQQVFAPLHHIGWYRKTWYPADVSVPGWTYITVGDE